jgi:hypothetical protein
VKAHIQNNEKEEMGGCAAHFLFFIILKAPPRVRGGVGEGPRGISKYEIGTNAKFGITHVCMAEYPRGSACCIQAKAALIIAL